MVIAVGKGLVYPQLMEEQLREGMNPCTVVIVVVTQCDHPQSQSRMQNSTLLLKSRIGERTKRKNKHEKDKREKYKMKMVNMER